MRLGFQPAVCCKYFSLYVHALMTKYGRNLNVYRTGLRISHLRQGNVKAQQTLDSVSVIKEW